MTRTDWDPEQLRQEREARDLSREQLGDILGVSRQTIRRWELPPERGGGRPSHASAELVRSWLRGDLEPPRPPPVRTDAMRLVVEAEDRLRDLARLF